MFCRDRLISLNQDRGVQVAFECNLVIRYHLLANGSEDLPDFASSA